MKFLIVSGRSGSGKTTALQVLEDIGYYCVDNLPVGLLPTLAVQIQQDDTQQAIAKVAVGIDARNVSSQLANFPQMLKQIKQLDVSCDVIYLDAHDETLLQRFSSTRRKHPLSSDSVSLAEAITQEKELLTAIASLANLTLDTSHLSTHELRSLMKDRVRHDPSKDMALMFQSFGFKHGVPADTDLVFDIRCLPNPYWDPELRLYTGLDQPVIDYLKGQSDVKKMAKDITEFLEQWLPRFEHDNRGYMTVSIGCTGGQHRSVYMVEVLAEHFKQQASNVKIRHREKH